VAAPAPLSPLPAQPKKQQRAKNVTSFGKPSRQQPRLCLDSCDDVGEFIIEWHCGIAATNSRVLRSGSHFFVSG
jgi:hypothetical protein